MTDIMPPVSFSDDIHGVQALACPSCGSSHLHHGDIEVYDRGEDQPEGLHVAITDAGTVTDRCLRGNPSDRRHGLAIRFECENCAMDMELTIAQHKGNTLVAWRETAEK